MPESERSISLLPLVTCPTCWYRFPPEEILWVATHGSLIGDSRAGAAEYRRFLPTLFTVDGRALDEKGEACQELACPRCHAIVNRGLLEMEPLFLSILGAPSSGKSFYLATMIHSVGAILSKQFHLRFENAAPRANQLMTEYVKTLFDYEDHTKLVKLEKTDRTGKWYYETHVGEQDLLMSRPYLYSVQPDETHPLHGRRREVSRMICLYDNAGEHFLPGAVTSQTPVIDHMAKSEALLFIYDPTQESAFRRACRACRDASLDPQLESAATTYPQADVLSEAASRVRQLTNMPVTEKFDRPLIVIVHKFDAWRPLLKKSPKALDDVIRAGHRHGCQRFCQRGCLHSSHRHRAETQFSTSGHSRHELPIHQQLGVFANSNAQEVSFRLPVVAGTISNNREFTRAFHDCVYAYPASAYQAFASCLVTFSRACRIASSRSVRDLGSYMRNNAFTLDHIRSIGFMSGE